MGEKLAYAVTETDENTGGIVFAKSGIEARRLGASIFHGGEFEGLSCRRARWADHCAESGDVPASLMIAHGWHFECSWSGQRIDEDYLAEKRLPISGVVGSQHGPVFACKTYAKHYERDRNRRRRWGDDAINRFKAVVSKRLPGAIFVEPHHSLVTSEGDIHQVIVYFTFPGQKYGNACLRYSRDTYRPCDRIGPVPLRFMCSNGDAKVFESWAAQQKALSPSPLRSGG